MFTFTDDTVNKIVYSSRDIMLHKVYAFMSIKSNKRNLR